MECPSKKAACRRFAAILSGEVDVVNTIRPSTSITLQMYSNPMAAQSWLLRDTISSYAASDTEPGPSIRS
ncbi:MAG TPA: hypothetical protein PLU38_02970 [Kiritimatiellia bacterium]|nr:hypothetical protein [Kiritimatiellia bacterium]